MTILALEFSSEQRSVAVAQICASLVPAAPVMKASRSRQVGALELVGQALRDAGLEREQIDCIAVGLGPGSYTGIRSAIALAQGWQLASRPGGVKLLGIGSVECLLKQAQAAALFGRVNIIIDAQREEFCLATCTVGERDCAIIEPLRLATQVEIQAREKAGEIILGPEIRQWFPGGRELFPDAATLAALAAGHTDFVSGEKLEPIYLRETSFVKAPPTRVVS